MRFLIVLIGFCLLACGGNQDTKNSEDTQSASNSSSKSCLVEMTDPTSWLTLADAAKSQIVPKVISSRKSIYLQIAANIIGNLGGSSHLLSAVRKWRGRLPTRWQ